MNLLFCADQSANYSEMSRLVTAFAARGHTCLFLFPASDARDQHYTAVLDDLAKKQADGTISHLLFLDLDEIARITAGIDAFSEDVPPKPRPEKPKKAAAPSGRRSLASHVRSLPSKVKRSGKWAVRATLNAFYKGRKVITRHSAVKSAVSIVYMCRYYGKLIDGIDHLMSPHEIDAILLPEEITSPFWSGILKFARTKSIPVVVCPYTICNQEEAFQSLKTSPAFQSSKNRVAARLFPSWRMRREGHDIVRLPQSHIIAHEWHRMRPRDPWMMNSGRVDRICVESAAIKAYFEAAGIPRKSLVVTGSPAVDEIHACRASASEVLDELRSSANWSDTKPILLIGGCPNQLTARVPTCSFSTMEEIGAFVASAIEPIAADYHLVFRPHPSYLEFGSIMARHGFHTSMIPTQRLIAVSSLYVAFASATIRWAICAGVPTVNFDVFGYRYQEFANVPGVMSTDTPSGFKDIMSSLSYGSSTYNESKKQLASSEGDWTLLDGKSMQRLESVLHELIAPRPSGRPIAAQVGRAIET